MAEEVILEKSDENNDELVSLDKDISTENSLGGGGFKRESSKESTESFEEEKEEKSKEEKPWYKDKNFMLLVSACVFLIAILSFTLFYLTFSESNIKADFVANKPKLQQTPVLNDEFYKVNMVKIDNMVQKANALYAKGEIEQALKIYEQISIYNKSLSNYNLGVLQMEEKDYAKAIESFKKAISTGENQTVSAINAAVCALKLKDLERFKYYIDLAMVYLPNEGNSKLFEYYLSLINYYKGYYLEALQMFQKVKIEPYADTSKYLSAKIYSKIDLNEKAINTLKNQGNFEASLPLGLLYAKIGDYAKARENLKIAMKIERDLNQSLAAISLVDLKIGKYQDMYNRLHKNFKDNMEKYIILDTYKIKVKLQKSLFDINIAQEKFTKDFLNYKKDQIDLLFYFAPYQVFNIKQASLYIQKSNITNYIQDASDARKYLKESNIISSTNIKLAKIINYAINQQLRKANISFQELVSSYPEHSVLQYNLALSYAQLQDYEKAYKHFSSSYHLNPKNYIAGIFALLCAKLTYKDNIKFYNEILENMNVDLNFKDQIYKYMIFLSNDDYSSMLPFLDDNSKEDPLSLIFKAIIAKNNALYNKVDVQIAKLKNILDNDILVNMLYFNSVNSNLNIKEYAQNAQIYFKNLKLNYKVLFGGPLIVRELYTSLMHICGLLNEKRQYLKELIKNSADTKVDMILTLAYMDIFAMQFQEAYALYNILIDEYKIDDSKTLFLAAVAAIGANNPNSAIALLELAKLKDGSNKEAKVALGLLYQEVQNYEPALLQYKGVNNDFKSNFFTFDIQN